MAHGLDFVGRASQSPCSLVSHKGTQTPTWGLSWPHGTPPSARLPHCLPHLEEVRARHGRPSHPAVLAPPLLPACHPQDSGLPPFQELPSSRGHARPRALPVLLRGLHGPDCTLSRHTWAPYQHVPTVRRPAGDPVDSDPRHWCATPSATHKEPEPPMGHPGFPGEEPTV